MKLALGLILVILGILLVNGTLTANSLYNVVFNLIDFWPVILIFIGLGILSSVKGFRWVKYVNNILITLFVLFLFLWPSGSISEGEFETRELFLDASKSRNIETIEIHLKSDVLVLTLNNLSGMIREDKIGDLWYSTTPNVNFNVSGRLKEDRYILNLNAHKNYFLSFADKSKVVLNLNPAYKYVVYVDSGVFKGNLDFSNLIVEELNVESGIAEFLLSLSRSTSTMITLESGVTKGDIVVPEGVNLTLIADAGVKKIHSIGLQEHRFDSTYNFGSTEDSIKSTLKIDAGILKMEISR